METPKIPKIIHYFWFGRGEMPELLAKCVASWQTFCPDYEIKLWNEDNFDCTQTRYLREAYENEKWAFVSDAARLMVLYEYGGVYLDTDIELIRPIDDLLGDNGFIGFEKSCPVVGIGIVGTAPGLPWMKLLLKLYEDRHFIAKDGRTNIAINSRLATEQLVTEYGLVCNDELQVLEGGIKVYPSDYFYPLDYRTGEIELTPNSYCIHYYSGTWESPADVQFEALSKKWGRLLGARLAGYLAYIYLGFQRHGLKKSLKIIKRRLFK